MKNFNMILLILAIFTITSCTNHIVHNKYISDNDYAISETTKPIYLNLTQANIGSIFLSVKHDTSYEGYILNVHWLGGLNGHIFKKQDNMIKFLINGNEIKSFESYTTPHIKSYNIDYKYKEEVASFKIDDLSFWEIIYAKKVRVEITGNKNIAVAKFPPKAFKMLREFVRYSHN